MCQKDMNISDEAKLSEIKIMSNITSYQEAMNANN